jgi:hypothetical protein
MIDESDVFAVFTLFLISVATVVCLLLRVRLVGLSAMLSMAATIALVVSRLRDLKLMWKYRNLLGNAIHSVYAAVWVLILLVVVGVLLTSAAHNNWQRAAMLPLGILIGLLAQFLQI